MIWLMTVSDDSDYHRKGCTILREGRCIRCNRKLTHPDSILSGIGPECALKAFGA